MGFHHHPTVRARKPIAELVNRGAVCVRRGRGGGESLASLGVEVGVNLATTFLLFLVKERENDRPRHVDWNGV